MNATPSTGPARDSSPLPIRLVGDGVMVPCGDGHERKRSKAPIVARSNGEAPPDSAQGDVPSGRRGD